MSPRVIVAAVCTYGLAVSSEALVSTASAGWAQVTMQNNMPMTADLYYKKGNDNFSYGCRALARGFCTIQVAAPATYTFKATDGRRSTFGTVTIQEGTSPVWTIFEKDVR